MLPIWIIGRSTVVAKPAPTATPPRPVTPSAEEIAARKVSPPIRRRPPVRLAPVRDEAAEADGLEGDEEAGAGAAPAPEPAQEPAPEAASPPKLPARIAKPGPAANGNGTSAPRSTDICASVASRFAAITKGSFGARPAGDAPPAPAKPRPPSARPAAETAAAGRQAVRAPAARQGRRPRRQGWSQARYRGRREGHPREFDPRRDCPGGRCSGR